MAAATASRLITTAGMAVSGRLLHQKLKFQIFINFSRFIRHICTTSEELYLEECRNLLQVTKNCTSAELREAFLKLARKFHPDSGGLAADATKFTNLQNAYRTLHDRISKENTAATAKEIEEEKEDAVIKHTAPQHRQYLSFEGVGTGTPSQRLQQYQKYRVSRAIDAVTEHKIGQVKFEDSSSLVYKDKVAARRHKISNAMERLVEDLILEAMSKGEFDNLRGLGKPLNNSATNPYIDTTTHKLNQVLINNGYTPEWVLQEKEIRRTLNNLRHQLVRDRQKLGPSPLNPNDQEKWKNILNRYQSKFNDLNIQVNKYNLVVPFLYKQMAHFELKRESARALQVEPSTSTSQPQTTEEATHDISNSLGVLGILGLFSVLFK